MPSVPAYRTFTGRQSRPALRIVTDASNPPAGLADKEVFTSPTPSDYLPLPPIDTLFSPPPHRKSFNNNTTDATLPPLNQVFHDALNRPITEAPRPHVFAPLRVPPVSPTVGHADTSLDDYRIPSRSMLPPPATSTSTTSTSSNATTSDPTTTAWNTPLPLSAVPRVRAVEPPGEPFYVHSFRFPKASRAAGEGVGLGGGVRGAGRGGGENREGRGRGDDREGRGGGANVGRGRGESGEGNRGRGRGRGRPWGRGIEAGGVNGSGRTVDAYDHMRFPQPRPMGLARWFPWGHGRRADEVPVVGEGGGGGGGLGETGEGIGETVWGWDREMERLREEEERDRQREREVEVEAQKAKAKARQEEEERERLREIEKQKAKARQEEEERERERLREIEKQKAKARQDEEEQRWWRELQTAQAIEMERRRRRERELEEWEKAKRFSRMWPHPIPPPPAQHQGEARTEVLIPTPEVRVESSESDSSNSNLNRTASPSPAAAAERVATLSPLALIQHLAGQRASSSSPPALNPKSGGNGEGEGGGGGKAVSASKASVTVTL